MSVTKRSFVICIRLPRSYAAIAVLIGPQTSKGAVENGPVLRRTTGGVSFASSFPQIVRRRSFSQHLQGGRNEAKAGVMGAPGPASHDLGKNWHHYDRDR